ncbi:hypothetical protein SARC_01037 [Sphaeroforma arctica JP610]|uniref:LicD/FKTN/FKRP nucleotidyltransferase domain-containing protein n=1 Tax=Sphaeroforma arctica JP610 TaxID=667725 RepID=A0A0L0GD59_9EUKA|nr:hypothetical protein SARC_01037 [Sphaeroforma arctica JP610]KNC86844.1 hypothetical protein SARC_01037 [Sphaeroforma arctica JP610]|eukprot:XP_014160746.1 hypothetical protein SARC_01037 [Sphaeroforma arctica JP610]
MRRHSREFHLSPNARNDEAHEHLTHAGLQRKVSFYAQLAGLLISMYLAMKYFHPFNLLFNDCRYYRFFHMEWCTVFDFVLDVLVCIAFMMTFIVRKTLIYHVLRRRLRSGWADAKGRYRLKLVMFGIAMLLLYGYYFMNVARTHMHRADKQPCHTRIEKLRGLVDLGERISAAFFDLGINVFLDYGSLLGAMRYNGPLPWDRDIDVGILLNQMEDKGVRIDMVLLSFSQHGLTEFYYDYWGGFFRADGDYAAAADVMLWKDYFDTGYLKRCGWEAFVAPVAYSLFHNFPKKMVEPPFGLPEVRFGNGTFNTPHDPLEFLKFRYLENWYTEIRPHGCDDETYLHWDGEKPPYLPFKEPEYIRTALAAEAEAKEKALAAENFRHGVARLDWYFMD